MVSTGILLLLNTLLFTLRVSAPAGAFPRPLRQAEEKELLQAAEQGDPEAKNKLIEHNLRLVAHIVKKYYNSTGDQDDLISIGTIGLIKAVNTYDSSKNIKLATYASRCIENEILMYLRKTRRINNEVSLSETLDGDQEGNSLSLMDVISVDDTMLEDIHTRDACALVRQCVSSCLTGREKEIIIRRYGLDGEPPETQKVVAKRFGISRSYVSRLESKAITKLREEMEKSRM